MPEPDEQSRERLCQVCRRTPVTAEGRGDDQTCATCLGKTRTHIKNIGIMATAILGEAIRLNLNSQAAALAGPTADPETWGYRRMSALANRIDPKWLDDQVDMHHPSWVLGTWEREARLHLNQLDDPGARPTLTEARHYLDTHLTRLAHDPDFAFDELATDVRQCHDHVERVLHLEEHVDRGAPCPACGQADLRKDYGTTEDTDRWTCPRCREWWDEESYRLRVAGGHLQLASALTITDLAQRLRVTPQQLRTWSAPHRVRRDGELIAEKPRLPCVGRDASGRKLYAVKTAEQLRDLA